MNRIPSIRNRPCIFQLYNNRSHNRRYICIGHLLSNCHYSTDSSHTFSTNCNNRSCSLRSFRNFRHRRYYRRPTASSHTFSTNCNNRSCSLRSFRNFRHRRHYRRSTALQHTFSKSHNSRSRILRSSGNFRHCRYCHDSTPYRHRRMFFHRNNRSCIPRFSNTFRRFVSFRLLSVQLRIFSSSYRKDCSCTLDYSYNSRHFLLYSQRLVCWHIDVLMFCIVAITARAIGVIRAATIDRLIASIGAYISLPIAITTLAFFIDDA